MPRYKQQTHLQAALVDLLNECRRARARYVGSANPSKLLSVERVALLAEVDAPALYNALGVRRHNSVGSDNLLACIIAMGFDIELVAHKKELTSEQQEAFYGPRRSLAQRIASEPGHRRDRSEMLSYPRDAIRGRVQDTVPAARKRTLANVTASEVRK